jgi:hypothetical protein
MTDGIATALSFDELLDEKNGGRVLAEVHRRRSMAYVIGRKGIGADVRGKTPVGMNAGAE